MGDTNQVSQLTDILKTERRRIGLSQEHLGKKIGISKAYVSQLEAGGRRINIGLWLKWCNALRISPKLIWQKYEVSLQPKEGKMQEFKRIREYKGIIDEMFELGLDPELEILLLPWKEVIHLKKKQSKGRRKNVKKEREISEEIRKEVLEYRIRPAKSAKGKMLPKEFAERAIMKLRQNPYKGIHTVYSGFNKAWKDYYGTDPVKGIQELAQQGKIEIRPAKGGAIIYLPGEGFGPKNVLEIILE